MGKDNDDARAVGTSFYSIICLKDLNLDVSIIEIPGQMSKEDYVHFLKDRMKIAVNLKKMMKNILRKKLVMDDAKELKIYGMQVYKNQVHVYCLMMPLLGMFRIVKVLLFDIPNNQATVTKDFPQYIKYLTKTFGLIECSAYDLVNHLTENDHYESDDTQTSLCVQIE